MSKTVFTNGCFDILTVAHFNLLSRCRTLAGESGTVIIGLDSDAKIKKDKGWDRPYFNFNERREALKSLICDGRGMLIDEIRTFNTNEELHAIIKEIKPDIIVKSDQWKNNVVGADIAEVVYYTTHQEFSTTKIVKRVKTKDMNHVIIDPFDRIEEK